MLNEEERKTLDLIHAFKMEPDSTEEQVDEKVSALRESQVIAEKKSDNFKWTYMYFDFVTYQSGAVFNSDSISKDWGTDWVIKDLSDYYHNRGWHETSWPDYSLHYKKHDITAYFGPGGSKFVHMFDNKNYINGIYDRFKIDWIAEHLKAIEMSDDYVLDGLNEVKQEALSNIKKANKVSRILTVADMKDTVSYSGRHYYPVFKDKDKD